MHIVKRYILPRCIRSFTCFATGSPVVLHQRHVDLTGQSPRGGEGFVEMEPDRFSVKHKQRGMASVQQWIQGWPGGADVCAQSVVVVRMLNLNADKAPDAMATTP